MFPGFHSRSAVAKLLCSKSFANVPHYGHTSKLKWNLGPADLTENRNLEHCSQNSGTKEIVVLA